MCKLWILFDQFISNIQEIVDIELMLDFIYMLFFIFILIPNDRKRGNQQYK